MSTRTPETIGVGLLGYAFMGRAHSHAYRTIATLEDPPLLPRLVAVSGRDATAVGKVATRFGYDRAVTGWRDVVLDPEVELFDNSGPNALHAEPTVAAAEAGKHVVCEKPLGRDADESYNIWQRVAATGVKHLCAFNYRFVPAIRLARDLIRRGELGEIRHVRGRYLQDWGADLREMAWRFDRTQAGSGALGDLGSHLVDLSRYLVGEIAAVDATTRTFVSTRGGAAVGVDDAFAAAVEFADGAIGTLEASRFAHGRRNDLQLEVNGSQGSLSFDLTRLNELEVDLRDNGAGTGGRGPRRILVTDPHHPFMEHWWPPGHVIGWEHTFVHELHHLLAAIRDGGDVAPHGADFEDGYRAAEVCDAIARAAATRKRQLVTYRADAAVAAVGGAT
jgi:predicted dehydrogenase